MAAGVRGKGESEAVGGVGGQREGVTAVRAPAAVRCIVRGTNVGTKGAVCTLRSVVVRLRTYTFARLQRCICLFL